LPAIDNLLVSVGLKADQMDLFAFTAGPGSFTGLRVGMSTIKGLAFILQKPVIGVYTLDALARNVPEPPTTRCSRMPTHGCRKGTGVHGTICQP